MPTLQALRACRLYKFWAILGMRAQVDLLTWLADRWNIQDHCFMIGVHQLKIELSDIYFLTGLSKRGEQLSLFGTRPDGQSIASLQLEFYDDQVDPKDKRLILKISAILSLKLLHSLLPNYAGVQHCMWLLDRRCRWL